MDVTLQWRNKLYVIGIAAGVLVAIALSQLGGDDQMYLLIPTLMLAVAGGSTLLYVAGMIIFEKDEGTLNATIVSPLRTSEYISSKVITLTLLATLEAVIMVGGSMLIISRTQQVSVPNLWIMVPAVLATGILYTLLGIALIVRYDKITDFLLPMGGIAIVLQIPMLYFLGWIDSPLFLLIPSSAPTMLVRGAYVELTTAEWIYGIVYTAVLLIAMTAWAYQAFKKHVIMKVG
jgi:fluoroquinolone transport system permease protein